MINGAAALAGLLLAAALHALGWHWRRRNPRGTTLFGFLAAALVTLACIALLGPFTGELHVAAMVTLIGYWCGALLVGGTHSRTCHLATWVAIAGQALEQTLALALLLGGGKVVEALFYRGADDAPEWIVARTACGLAQVALLVTLALLSIGRMLFKRNERL